MDCFFSLYAASGDSEPLLQNDSMAMTNATQSDSPRIVCDEDDFFRALAAANEAREIGNTNAE